MAQRRLVESKFANRAFIAAGLGIVTALIYAGAMRNGFVAYDDPDYVTGNVHVLGGITLDNILWAITAPAAGNWHPLTWVSHMVDVSLFGTAAWGHHFTSILMHAMNAAILFLALAEMTGAKWQSAATAALFEWHPLRVESVAWVAERKDVLSGLFFMMTLWAYARYARATKGDSGSRRFSKGKIGWYAVVAMLLALGLMAKPMLVTTPFVLLLLDWWPLGRWGGVGQSNVLGSALPGPSTSRSPRRIEYSEKESGVWIVLEKLPLVALAVGSSVITFLVQRQAGAVAEVEGKYSVGNRMANAVVAYARYVGK
ncbi:MAG TPA: hypothetical protein VHS31_19890, partial [Tepidisphaeraceae bacterium]|nr:hypothetical protein [Tepidisphaeraceae bacterium]